VPVPAEGADKVNKNKWWPRLPGNHHGLEEGPSMGGSSIRPASMDCSSAGSAGSVGSSAGGGVGIGRSADSGGSRGGSLVRSSGSSGSGGGGGGGGSGEGTKFSGVHDFFKELGKGIDKRMATGSGRSAMATSTTAISTYAPLAKSNLARMLGEWVILDKQVY
jgi:hypothetical protein